MSRYIDADELIEDMKKDQTIHFFGGARMCDIQRMIDKQPTVNAVPVVRCEDCVYFTKLVFPPVDGDGLCSKMFGGTYLHWFCACGKRKEE